MAGKSGKTLTQAAEVTAKSQAVARVKRTEAYAEAVRKEFAAAVNDLLALNKSVPSLGVGEMYSYDAQSKSLRNKAEAILRRLRSAAVAAIKEGVEVEWDKANDECDKLVSTNFGKEALSQPAFSGWVQRNGEARNAFLSRTEGGMGLSDRVWKSVQQLREEMEVAMTVAIGEGESAGAMSRKVRQYLNDPDLMFRRFRYKDENGDWKRKWKKKIRDEKTGKVRWIDYDRDDYKTGRGVYKSSARNAMRVARTETNMAYRKADNERWGQMDFVLGQRIALSKSHPAEDICDELAGDYPVDFEFPGWHPQCFCVATPILPDEEEMRKATAAAFRGETYTPKGNRVTEYPKAFRDWVTGNKTKIAAARAAGTEPYFLRNNKAAVDGILNPSKKAQTILDKAAARHAARTPEQVAAIQKAWDERKAAHQQIRTDAAAMLARAQDYGEVDWAAMDKAIASGDLMGMEAQTKSLSSLLANMDAKEAALGKLIPDAHKWHKQFTLTELQAVYDSVEKKLASLSGLSLEDKAKKLQFETDYVKNPSAYKHGATKYKTWEVAASAYEKELAAVSYEIGIQDASLALADAIQYAKAHPKMTKLAGLINAAQKAIGLKADLADIDTAVAAAVKEYQKHISAATSTTTPFVPDADAFSKQRKDNALWAKTTSEADAKLRDKCGEVWRAATKAQKDALYGYTESYHNINEPLRGLTYYGSKSSKDLGLRRIPEITTAIDKSSSNFDMWVQRGDSRIALKKFGLTNYATATDSEIKALVGKTGTEGAFWSAGVAKGKGFGGEIIFNIYMPKGTKAMYMEPFSYFGKGSGRAWNGVDTQNSFGGESEILLQRGSTFRITKVEKGANGTFYIDVEVVGQDALPFPYTGGYPYL